MRKAIKPIVKIIGATVILVSALLFADMQLKKLGNELSGQILKNLISRESKGLYTLTFDKLELNTVRKTLRIYNAHLKFDIGQLSDSSTVSNLYQVSIDSVDIDLKSVIKIYSERELMVRGVEVVNPQIIMTKINPQSKGVKLSRETGELYEIIEEYLTLLQIDYFSVKGGGLNHSPSQLVFGHIDFNVDNFVLDPSNRKRKVFYSEAINLGIYNQEILLPDSIHMLSFTGFKLSTNDSLLSFRQLRIQPRPHIDISKSYITDHHNIYDIIIPQLDLKGINYLKAYEDNHLFIDQVSIPQPIITIQTVVGDDRGHPGSENTLGRSLITLFDLIRVKHFRINEAALDLTLKAENQQQFKSENISIELFEIQLDTTNYEFNSRDIYFENAKISIQQYKYLLPDSIHNIEFKKLDINTFDSTLIVDQLLIIPSRRARDSLITKFTFRIPLLKLQGINYQEALVDKRLLLKNMQFDNPRIAIQPYVDKKTEKVVDTVFEARDLHRVLKPYFEIIKTNKIDINNATFGLSNLFSLQEINSDMLGLVIDSTTNSWHQLADSIRFTAKTLQFKAAGSSLSIGELAATKQWKKLKITDASFTDYQSKSQFEVKESILSGIQLDSLFANNRIMMDSLTLDHPTFVIHQKLLNTDKKKSGGLSLVNPLPVLIKHANLQYFEDSLTHFQTHNLGAQLTVFDKIFLQHLSSDSSLLVSKQFNHSIKLKQLQLHAGQKTLVARNISILPAKGSDSLSIGAKIPQIRLSGLLIDSLINNRHLIAESLTANITDLKLSALLAAANTKKQNDSSSFSINLKSIILELNKSDVNIKPAENDPWQLNSNKLSVSLSAFQYPQDSKFSEKQFFYAQGFGVGINGFTANHKSIAQFSVGSFTYDNAGKTGQLKNLNYAAGNKETAAKIEFVSLHNWEAEKLIIENALLMDSLLLGNIDIQIAIGDTTKTVENTFTSPFSRTQIGTILAKNVFLNMQHQKHQRAYNIHQADLKITHLSLDSLVNWKKLPTHLQSLRFSGKNYLEEIGDHYTISAANYLFEFPKRELSMATVKLRNRYDRFAYTEVLTYQKDWFELDLDAIHLSGINLDAMMENTFLANKLTLTNAKLTVFRDLNIPIDTVKYVPLLQENLLKLPVSARIDTVKVNTDIYAYIVPKEGTGLGYLSFNNLRGSIYGISTRTALNDKNIRLSAEGLFNNQGAFQANVIFPMQSEKSEYHFTGKISNMSLSSLNDMLVPVAAVEIRSGENEELSFNFNGDNEFATGSMYFRYSGLRINILDSETYQSSGWGNSIKSFFANTFVVRTKNPNMFKLNKGLIFYEREQNKSIFNYWGKSLLSGAVSSIGINSNLEKARQYNNRETELVD